jgi:hypothetical protein
MGLTQALKRALSIFLAGQAHALSMHSYIIFPVILFSSVLMFRQSKSNHRKPLFWIIIIMIGGIALFSGFQKTAPISRILATVKAIIPMQFDRFYFLYPMLWALAFAIVLSILRFQSSKMHLLVSAIILLQIMVLFRHHELFINRNSPSVEEFFAEKQFKEIQDYIGQPLNSYRIGSIGIHPSVSLFNGFYTVDGYWANYPLTYKHAFRKIIANELEKSKKIKDYFDDWGSRAYLFNSQIRINWVEVPDNSLKLNNPEYDWEAFYDLGGRYLFSAFEMDKKSSPQLIFRKQFNHKASAWTIYLYEIFPSNC